jgi:hypothetical protein
VCYDAVVAFKALFEGDPNQDRAEKLILSTVDTRTIDSALDILLKKVCGGGSHNKVMSRNLVPVSSALSTVKCDWLTVIGMSFCIHFMSVVFIRVLLGASKASTGQRHHRVATAVRASAAESRAAMHR